MNHYIISTLDSDLFGIRLVGTDSENNLNPIVATARGRENADVAAIQIQLQEIKTLRVDSQPYGQFVLGELHLKYYRGYPVLCGKVVSGTSTSRLFHYSATHDITDEYREIYGIRLWELASGNIVRVAM